MRAMHNVLGGTLDPHAAYLLLRGMKTLGVRVRQQNATALYIARQCAPRPCLGMLCCSQGHCCSLCEASLARLLQLARVWDRWRSGGVIYALLGTACSVEWCTLFCMWSALHPFIA